MTIDYKVQKRIKVKIGDRLMKDVIEVSNEFNQFFPSVAYE